MSRIILTLVFCLLVTPLAVLRRALRHDTMRLREWKKGTGSVFVTREHTYTAKDIENPF